MHEADAITPPGSNEAHMKDLIAVFILVIGIIGMIGAAITFVIKVPHPNLPESEWSKRSALCGLMAALMVFFGSIAVISYANPDAALGDLIKGLPFILIGCGLAFVLFTATTFLGVVLLDKKQQLMNRLIARLERLPEDHKKR